MAMAFLLYIITVALLLFAARRFVGFVSWRTAILLALFPLCFTGRALLTGGVYAPVDMPYATEPLHWMGPQFGIDQIHNGTLNDVYTQMIPYRKALQDSLRNGEWPLWNRYTHGGEILAAAAQPAPYSPFTLIALLLPVAVSFTYTAAILFFLAALSSFLFARELECSDGVALFGAAGWMYSTALAFFIDWPLSFAWGLLPFLCVAVRRTARRPGVASASLLTTALTLVTVAGHPESVLHLVSIGVAYGLFEMIRHRQQVFRTTVTALAAGVVTLLVCAIYLLPIAEAGPQTREYALRRDYFRHIEHGVDLQEAGARLAADFLPSLENRTWRSSAFTSLPPDTAAVGSIVLAAAVYALWRRRRGETWFFGGVLIFCLVEHADWWPLSKWVSSLPLFDIALNLRYSYGASFAFVVLAVLGLDEFRRREDTRGFAVTASAVLMAVSLAAIAAERFGLVKINSEFFGDYRLFADVVLLAVAILFVTLRPPWRAVVPTLLVLVLVQRTMQEGGVYPSLPASAAYPPIPLFAPMKQVREPFRIVGQGYAFVPGTAALYGLEDARGYAALTLARTAAAWPLWCVDQPVWFNRVNDLTHPFLSFLNVRFAIVTMRAPMPPGWREVARSRRARLLENTRAIARAFVPATVRIGASEIQALVEMESETDFRNRVWINGPEPLQDIPNGPGRVSIRHRRQGFALDADMSGDGWVIVSEPAWDGWRAYVDGRRLQHRIANLGYVAIFVPKGHHTVKLVYWPPAFVIGRGISAAAIAGVLMFAVVYGRRKRPVAA